MKTIPFISLSLRYQDHLRNSIAIGLELSKENTSMIARNKNPYCSDRKGPLKLKHLSVPIVEKVKD